MLIAPQLVSLSCLALDSFWKLRGSFWRNPCLTVPLVSHYFEAVIVLIQSNFEWQQEYHGLSSVPFTFISSSSFSSASFALTFKNCLESLSKPSPGLCVHRSSLPLNTSPFLFSLTYSAHPSRLSPRESPFDSSLKKPGDMTACSRSVFPSIRGHVWIAGSRAREPVFEVQPFTLLMC